MKRFLVRFIPRFALVCGNSMSPTYNNGETLFTLPVLSFNRLREGDVVIFTTPYDNERIAIKRVIMKSTKTREVFLMGDNREDSYDSRSYGFIPFENILGKVVDQRERRM